MREFLESLSPEQIEKGNELQIKDAVNEHNEFKKAFDVNCCYLCGMKFSYFSEFEPCLHWFLLPEGIRKRHFDDNINSWSYFQIESYLRWIASTETYIGNINDLHDDNSKLLESTIRFKNIEWSLNCSENDYKGHEQKTFANFPHFHLQIFNNGKPFIRYNDYHIPFKDQDIFKIEALKNDDLVENINIFGDGISILENERDLAWIDQIMYRSKDEENATFHTRSFFEMPAGQSISEEKLMQLNEESKVKGIPLRKYMKEKIPGIKMISWTGSGKGVVEKKKRKKRK